MTTQTAPGAPAPTRRLRGPCQRRVGHALPRARATASRFLWRAEPQVHAAGCPTRCVLRMHDVLGIERASSCMPTRTDLTIRSTWTPLPSQQAVTSGRGATRCQRHPAACKAFASGGRAWRSSHSIRGMAAGGSEVFDHVMRCIDGPAGSSNFAAGSALPHLRPWIANIPAPVVIDHFGRIDPGLGWTEGARQALLTRRSPAYGGSS